MRRVVWAVDVISGLLKLSGGPNTGETLLNLHDPMLGGNGSW